MKKRKKTTNEKRERKKRRRKNEKRKKKREIQILSNCVMWKPPVSQIQTEGKVIKSKRENLVGFSLSFRSNLKKKGDILLGLLFLENLEDGPKECKN